MFLPVSKNGIRPSYQIRSFIEILWEISKVSLGTNQNTPKSPNTHIRTRSPYLAGWDMSEDEQLLWELAGCCWVQLRRWQGFLTGLNSVGSDMKAGIWKEGDINKITYTQTRRAAEEKKKINKQTSQWSQKSYKHLAKVATLLSVNPLAARFKWTSEHSSCKWRQKAITLKLLMNLNIQKQVFLWQRMYTNKYLR